MSRSGAVDPILPFFDSEEVPTSISADNLRSTEWLVGLSTLAGIGNRRAVQLAKHFKNANKLKAADPLEVKAVIGTTKVDFSELAPFQPYTEDDVKIIGYFDEKYPKGLRDLSDAPIVLWYRGEIPDQKSIAIVGTREVDDWGKNTTRKMSQMASDRGFAVVSGLALGVDTEAHIGCLEGSSPTVAILACDVRFPTPKSNKSLAEEILERGGCLIAEVPLGTETEGRNLVSRNRLQAAWAQSLLVTQCGIPSGTLHTIRFAFELERKVLALKTPHGVKDKQYSGNVALTQDYAFNPEILGGSKRFTESLKNRKYGADIPIGAFSDFERFLENVE